MKKCKPPQLIPWKPAVFIPIINMEDLVIIRKYGGSRRDLHIQKTIESTIMIVIDAIGRMQNV